MSGFDLERAVSAAILLFGAAYGLRHSIRLTRTYRKLREVRPPVATAIPAAMVAVAWIVTIAIGYFGILTLNALAGNPRFDWQAPVSAMLLALIGIVPKLLSEAMDRLR